MNDDNMNSSLSAQHIDTINVTAAQHDPIFDESGYQVGTAAKILKEMVYGKEKPQYKYDEGTALKKITDYVNSTYGQHYVGNGDVQTVDFWESLGSLETTCRDTAIKYLARYGKKGGKNEKDLLKAIHYIILMMYAKECENDPERYGDDR